MGCYSLLNWLYSNEEICEILLIKGYVRRTPFLGQDLQGCKERGWGIVRKFVWAKGIQLKQTAMKAKD